MIIVIDYTVHGILFCNLASSGQRHVDVISKSGTVQASILVRYKILLVRMLHPVANPLVKLTPKLHQRW